MRLDRIEEDQVSTCLEDESVGKLDVSSITDRLDTILRADKSAQGQSSLLTDEIEGSESHDDDDDDGWLESVDSLRRVSVGRRWDCSKGVPRELAGETAVMDDDSSRMCKVLVARETKEGSRPRERGI